MIVNYDSRVLMTKIVIMMTIESQITIVRVFIRFDTENRDIISTVSICT